MQSKTEAMRPIIAGLGCEVFESERRGLFNITAMRQRARNGQYGGVRREYLEPKYIEWLIANRSHELQRCWDMLIDPAAPWFDDPALVIYDSGFYNLVDGTHRVLCRWMLKLPDFPYWLVPVEEAVRVNPVVLGMADLHFDWGDTVVTPEGLRKR